MATALNKGTESKATYAVSIGGANFDIVGKPDSALRQNDSNPGRVQTAAGGVARNVAENLARLGVDSRLISMVGDDYFGRMLLRLSQQAGIDVQHVQMTDAAPTCSYLSVLDDSGDMQLAIADMDALEQLNTARLKPLRPLIQNSALIVVDANLGANALAWLADEFAAKPIFADTVSTHKACRLKPCLSSIHTLKTTRLEAQELVGTVARRSQQLGQIASHLHAGGVKRVFISLGELGVFYSTGDEQGIRDPIQKHITAKNTGGAGDALLAGLAFSWLNNLSLHDALRFSLATAHLALEHAANSNPALTADAVEKVLEAHSGA